MGAGVTPGQPGRARFADGLERVFGGSWDLASPTFTVEPYGLEHRILFGYRSFAFAQELSAVAANINQVQFRNPAASGTMAIFERLECASDAAAATDIMYLSIGAVAADLATLYGTTQLVPADGRLGSLLPSLRVSTNAINAGFATPNIFRLPMAVKQGLIACTNEIVIPPGYGLTWYTNVVNTKTWLNARWRERQLPELEAIS